jgi:bacillithiol synthase
LKTSVHKIPFKKIKLLSTTAMDYLYNTNKFSEFIELQPTFENFEKSIEKRKEMNRTVLVSELEKQNLNSNKKSIANIELLKEKNTFTITTGHQICLFTGPLYSLYKIISTLNLSQELAKKYPSYNFVPVFWMATEDHDFEEINHLFLDDKKVSWNSHQKGPVGRFSTSDMASFLDEVKSMNQSDLTRKLCGFYENSNTLAEAHRKVVDCLFGDYGLVILDADSRELKKEMIPIFTKELTERGSEEKVNQLSETLVEKGYKKQVTPREINLFYQENGLRERIVFEENKYKILNTNKEFTEKEILDVLNEFPERFSPNVVLRPIYQEKILPNLGYIGGPGELAYWLQLKNAFQFYEVNFPVLVLRNSAVLIPSHISKKIAEFPFSLSEYFEKQDKLIALYLEKNTEIDFEPEINEIEKLFTLAKEKASMIDFTLEKTVIAELKRAQNSIKKIEKKALKAEKKNHSVALNRIQKIKDSFFPGGTFQERKSNIISFYEEDLIKKITHNLISLEDNLTLIELN